MPGSLLHEVTRLLDEGHIPVEALGRAWARALPVVTLVPAFGLRAVPAPARVAMALGLMAGVAPALAGSPLPSRLLAGTAPWPLVLVAEVLTGLPVALAAAVPLWAATSAGGLVDGLRGVGEGGSSPVVEGKTSPLGVAFGLLAGATFLATGGPAHVAQALLWGGTGAGTFTRLAAVIVGGITLAIALAMPLAVATLIVEVATALVGRAASPAQVQSVLGPVKAVTLLVVLALVFERVATLLGTHLALAPP